MKTVSDVLRRNPVWVNPAHQVDTAIVLMRGHAVCGLPVLDGTQLVGMVLPKHLLGIEGQRKVEEIMDARLPSVTSVLPLGDAAEVMTRSQSECLSVVDDSGTLIGVLAQSDLLRALRRPMDPLTELPWSDSLREWALERLQAGQEITVLFIDVNDFGQFNKRHGHVVGDAILHSIARLLRERTDSVQDSVCRYGGDEFCIASLRTAPEADLLARQIECDVAALPIAEARGESVGVTVGWRGGRRTHERERVHYAATINNLINLASKDCLAKKPDHATQEGASPFSSDAPPPILSPNDFSASSFSAPVTQGMPPSMLPSIDMRCEGQTAHIRIEWK